MTRDERDALIRANTTRRDEVAFDLEQRRDARELRGEFFDDVADVAEPREIVRKGFEQPAAPQADDGGISDEAIDALVEFVNERLTEVTTPLIERIATLENIAEQRSAAWLDKMRRTR